MFSLAQHAQAQQQANNSAGQNQQTDSSIPAAPPESNMQDYAPDYAPRVAPAPTIAPIMSPRDQANYTARQQQRQQAAQGNSPQTTPTQTPRTGGTLTPVAPNNTSGTASAAAAAPVTGGAQTVPSATAAPAASSGASTAANSAADTTTPAAVSKPTNATGFAPQNSGPNLPLSSGTMPLAATTGPNAGIDMDINPNMVGYDPNQPAGPNNPVPYEVQLEQRTREIQEKARNMAFEQAKKSVLPMETYEIKDVLGRLKDTQEAIQTPAREAPVPHNVIRTVSTDPAATPQTINLAAGNVSTLNIVDVTGAPWPIVDIGFGGPFDVKPPEAGGHVIRITPLKDFARGNMVIRLLKMTTPITFTLQAGGDVVNYRFDARIPERGPNAKTPIIDRGINASAGDKVTTSFLEGVPPSGAKKLIVDGIDGRTSAYKFGGALYVRTPLSLLSPAWQGSATSADGMNVYVMNEAPVLLLSDKGSMVRARINEAKTSAGGF